MLFYDRTMSTGSEAIHPLDYRYGDAKVKHVFSQSERFRLILEFEGKVAEVQSELGIIPVWAGPVISKAAKAGIPLERVREKEKETQHEVAAVASCLEEAAGEAGRFVHFGLTSNDVLDTIMFMQGSEAGKRILELTKDLVKGLVKRAEESRHLLCVARTHGMHAEPYTYGLRFAVWSSEIVRCYLKLSDALSQAKVGKVSGAVGDYSALGARGPELESRVLASFGLKALTPTTQVIPRDVLTSTLLQLATLSSVLDRIATNLRNLHRTEIGEVREGRTERQVGSSAMPHKRNPIGCEKVSGLARVVRSLALASLEDVVLWDERDLTNSSAERVIMPEMFGLVSEQLTTMTEVVRNLVLNEEAIERNLNSTKGAIFSEFILGELVLSGMGRAEAHRLVSGIVEEVASSKKDFLTLLRDDRVVSSKISDEKLRILFDPKKALLLSDELIDKAIAEAGQIPHD